MFIDILCWFMITLGVISGFVFFGVIVKEVLEHDWGKLTKSDLNYEGFEKNFVETWEDSCVHYTFLFRNGYGATIVRAGDLWDMDVIRVTDESNQYYWEDVTYDMPFTDDILVDLTNDKVLELLAEIRDLPEDYYLWT